MITQQQGHSRTESEGVQGCRLDGKSERASPQEDLSLMPEQKTYTQSPLGDLELQVMWLFQS